MLSGNSLCNNPRVLKEGATLARHGYDVTVLGAWLEPEAKARDLRILEHIPFSFVPVCDRMLGDLQNAAGRMLLRAQSKAAGMLHGMTGIESRYQLGALVKPLLAHAKAINAALFIAHSEVALYVARQLVRAGARVGIDMEDWFSEDLLPQARRKRPLRLIGGLERELLLRCAYASCPSRAMSEALAAAYGCPAPQVVYNAFPLIERTSLDGLRKERCDPSIPSIVWYSQTIGPGRGLEDLADALALLEREVEVHLRGRAVPGIERWFRSRVRYPARVAFHPQVPNDELLSRIVEHDIGFAGEMRYCRNKDLTVSNKILHYLLGGLAVVASDTAGQREVAAQANGAVSLYQPGNARSLAQALASLLNSPERLSGAKAAALSAAEQPFCWEKQEPAMLAALDGALTKQADDRADFVRAAAEC